MPARPDTVIVSLAQFLPMKVKLSDVFKRDVDAAIETTELRREECVTRGLFALSSRIGRRLSNERMIRPAAEEPRQNDQATNKRPTGIGKSRSAVLFAKRPATTRGSPD